MPGWGVPPGPGQRRLRQTSRHAGPRGGEAARRRGGEAARRRGDALPRGRRLRRPSLPVDAAAGSAPGARRPAALLSLTGIPPQRERDAPRRKAFNGLLVMERPSWSAPAAERNAFEPSRRRRRCCRAAAAQQPRRREIVAGKETIKIFEIPPKNPQLSLSPPGGGGAMAPRDCRGPTATPGPPVRGEAGGGGGQRGRGEEGAGRG